MAPIPPRLPTQHRPVGALATSYGQRDGASRASAVPAQAQVEAAAGPAHTRRRAVRPQESAAPNPASLAPSDRDPGEVPGTGRIGARRPGATSARPRPSREQAARPPPHPRSWGATSSATAPVSYSATFGSGRGAQPGVILLLALLSSRSSLTGPGQRRPLPLQKVVAAIRWLLRGAVTTSRGGAGPWRRDRARIHHGDGPAAHCPGRGIEPARSQGHRDREQRQDFRRAGYNYSRDFRTSGKGSQRPNHLYC